jgi:membrane-associated phospholipid phosphatase
MLKHFVTRGLASGRRPRRDRHNRRPACRLRVEALEGRLLLSGDMVLRWNEALWSAARIGGLSGPGPNTRLGAIVQAAVYEAVNSIDGTHTPYLVDIPAPPFASEDAAVATAAHDAILGIFPAQKPIWDLELKDSLQGVKDSDAKTWGMQVGHAAAQIMLAVRAHDGSDAVVSYPPATKPGDWKPTPPPYLPALTPQWPNVTPFGLQSGSQFRSPPPPALTSPEYAADVNEIKQVGAFDSTTRTADQTDAALWWAGIPGIPASFIGMVNKIAENVAVARNNSLVDNARLFALLNLTLADETIGSFDSKQFHNLWRPVTAIREADTDGNPDTEADPNWMSLETTPNGPSYPSQHSGVAGAFSTVLAKYFGADNIPFSVSWEGLPGVTRSFDSFSQAAQECANSRIWLGIHYRFDTTAGLALGRSVGTYIYQNFLLPRTSPPPGGGAGSILLASENVTAIEGTSITFASVQGADARRAGLPVGQPNIYLVSADGTSKSVASDVRAMEASRVRSEGAQPQTRGSSLDDGFSSADPWQERFASAP